jgi:hypothetical protein
MTAYDCIRKTVRTFLVTFVTFESHKSPKSTKKVQKDGKVRKDKLTFLCPVTDLNKSFLLFKDHESRDCLIKVMIHLIKVIFTIKKSQKERQKSTKCV